MKCNSKGNIKSVIIINESDVKLLNETELILKRKYDKLMRKTFKFNII